MFIEISLSILAVICPIMVLFAYRQGIKDGKAVQEGKSIPPLCEATPKAAAVSQERQRELTLLDNIMNYDGTENGQKEVGE